MQVFQFTPLREGRQHRKAGNLQAIWFQFTPLREGRHEGMFDGDSYNVVSIHAPA